jgi:hypothetical protein
LTLLRSSSINLSPSYDQIKGKTKIFDQKRNSKLFLQSLRLQFQIDFDPDQTTAENDDELLNGIRKELHKHTIDTYGGSALISTPDQDPEEKDQKSISRWQKLNKVGFM